MQRNYVQARVLFYARGGRSTVPIGDGYAPYLRAASFADVLAVRVNGMPLEGKFDTEYGVALELTHHPRIDYSKLKEGTNFFLLEGPKTVGEGVVTSAIYEQFSGDNPHGV
jgi:hypothetical protein